MFPLSSNAIGQDLVESLNCFFRVGQLSLVLGSSRRNCVSSMAFVVIIWLFAVGLSDDCTSVISHSFQKCLLEYAQSLYRLGVTKNDTGYFLYHHHSSTVFSSRKPSPVFQNSHDCKGFIMWYQRCQQLQAIQHLPIPPTVHIERGHRESR